MPKAIRHIRPFRSRAAYATAALAALALSACEPVPGSLENPRLTDKSGRSVVTPAEGVELFMTACFNPGGTRAGAKRAARRGNFNIATDEKFGFTAGSRTKALSLVHFGENTCTVSFDAGIPNVNAGAQAAQLLIPRIKATKFGGSKGGGQVSFDSRKGTVTVGNNARARLDGASITLFRNR